MKMMKHIVLVFGFLCSGVLFAKININTATIDELVLLKGIGKSKAELIIKYRKEHGKFKTIQDLAKVKGMGEKTVKNIASKITVDKKTDLSDL